MAVGSRRRIPRTPALLVCVAIALGLAVLALRWWDRKVEEGLGRWAMAEVARRTGGVYRLAIGEVTFAPLDGSVAFDSAVVVTDTARNRRRAEPLPLLEWRSQGCRVTGVVVLGLIFRRAFAARELGCERVVASISLVAPASERRTPEEASQAAEQLAELPRSLGLSSVHLDRVWLPALRLAVRRPGKEGGSSVLLERARLEAGDVDFDPRARPGAGKGLAARRARLTADGFILRPDTTTRLAIAGVTADFPDSTLRLAGVRHEPDIPEDEWVRRVRVRRDRIRFEADSVRGRGVAYRSFLARGDLLARVLEVEGARLDVLTDKRIPRGRPKPHPIPQQVAAGPGPALRIDTLLVRGATIVYRERKPDTERPGRVSFDRVRGRAVHLHLPSRGKPLRIAARAALMGEGALSAEAEVPLDAPDFRYRLSATLDRMPAAALNRFLSTNEDYEFDEGEIDRITVRQTVRAGVATTTVTPRYHDLSVRPTGDAGGLVGSVKRAAKKFATNAFVVRSRNPDEDGDHLRTAVARHRYDPAKTWIQFLWFSVRDAAVAGIKE